MFVTMVTTVTMSSVAVMLVCLCICKTRSVTQPADSRASASWSQHSSMVSHSSFRPCRDQVKNLSMDMGEQGVLNFMGNVI